MPAQTLHRHFGRRMLPLAILAGLALAAVPPALYRGLVWPRLRAQASIYAGHIAASAREAAYLQPYLWRFNVGKIVQATALHLEQDDIASVQLTDCTGRPFFSSADTRETGWLGVSPVGSAPVVLRGEAVGSVVVAIDTTQYTRALWVTAAVSVPLGLALGLLLFFFPTRVVRRQSRHLSRVLDELHAAKQDLSRRVDEGVRKVRALSQRVVRAQETERQRIARDLHDELGHAIARIQMDAELALTRPGDATGRLREVAKGCERALGSLRRVVRELRPVELDAQSLPEALRSCAEDFEQRSGVTTYLRFAGEADLPAQVSLCLLRVLQEALTNIGRHARAHEVGIRVRRDPLGVTLEVTDDGRGFAPAEPTDGTGLLGMQERCEMLGGHVAIVSAPGQGTTITVELPIDVEG